VTVSGGESEARMTGKVLLRRLRWLIFFAWNIPPVFGLGFILMIGVLQPSQMIGILTTPIEPAYSLGWLAFSVWFLPSQIRPLADWLDAKATRDPGRALGAVRRFPFIFWVTFLIYLAVAPASVIVSAQIYTDFVATPYDWFRIELVALIVSIIVGLPIFFLIFDLFGQALGALHLSRPIVTIRTKVFMIGALVPLLIDTMLVQYYWTRTGYFTFETFGVWLLLEGLAIGGSLIFARSFGQALGPLQELIGVARPVPETRLAALRARSTDEIGVLTGDYRALLEEQRLQEEKQRVTASLLQSIIESVPIRVFWKDRDLRYLGCNSFFARDAGLTRPEQLIGKTDYEMNWKDQAELYRADDYKVIESGSAKLNFEEPQSTPDGRRIWLSTSKVPLRDEMNGEIIGVLGVYEDITERKAAEYDLRIAAVTFQTQEAILITGSDATIIRVNQAFQDITGYGKEEVIGQNLHILKSGRHDEAFYQAMWSTLRDTGKWSGEVWDKRKNGDIYPTFMTITAVYDDKQHLSNYVAVFTDISQRKQSEEEINQLAFYDPLTRLPNRRLLLDRLQQAMAASMRGGQHGALLMLDLDHFKTVNDTLGHAMGDLLLIEVAHRLKDTVRKGDTVARLGGDEFVVMLEGLSSQPEEAAKQTELTAEKIRGELVQPYTLEDHECHSTPSIGISLFHGQLESMDALFQHADVALYQAKSTGRNAIRFYDPNMQAALDIRASMEADLRHALSKQEFRLYYQIQVGSLSCPLGAEVLLRWEHPERGMVFPDQFIPLAEETGLIVPIGRWVLESVCAQLKAWQDDPLTRDLTLAVNVSARQFRQADFVSGVQRVLLGYGVKPSRLKLELSESVVLENVDDTIMKMQALKLLGVQFSMDDFGTRHSSLSHLKRLPLDQIKIDRSFMRNIATDPDDAAIVNTIIAMTRTLDLNVIAEGVETEEQREFLDRHGCHVFQGDLFSRPVTLDQFEASLKRSPME
jgi:diguanylate cyclase (GGDEF)-like protein/PAS domain S-box-containing protein